MNTNMTELRYIYLNHCILTSALDRDGGSLTIGRVKCSYFLFRKHLNLYAPILIFSLKPKWVQLRHQNPVANFINFGYMSHCVAGKTLKEQW